MTPWRASIHLQSLAAHPQGHALAFTRDQLNRLAEHGVMVFGPRPGVPPVTARYSVLLARPDGLVVEGRSGLHVGTPAVPPVGVRPLRGPPKYVEAVRPTVEGGGMAAYAVDYGSPSFSVRAEPGGWCIYTVVLGRRPERVHGRFESADETIDRILELLGAGPPDHLFCRAGPPQPVQFRPSHRTADVLGLARAIHEDQAFDRLPLLADALMDAGCDDEDLLAHARATGHVPGCWLVNLVLGKP